MNAQLIAALLLALTAPGSWAQDKPAPSTGPTQPQTDGCTLSDNQLPMCNDHGPNL